MIVEAGGAREKLASLFKFFGERNKTNAFNQSAAP